MSKNILFIVGSRRNRSFNRALARIAEEYIADRANVSFLDYADVPFIDQDIEFPAPEPAARARECVRQADAVWIFTPEYNHEIPGGLKNLLDWLSRPIAQGERITAVQGKPVTISGAGGRMATKDCRDHLAALLAFMKMDLTRENETGIALSGECFSTGRFSISAEDEERLKAQADSFLGYIEK